MATPIATLSFRRGTAAGLAVGQTGARYVDRIVGTTGTNINVSTTSPRTTGGAFCRLTPSAAAAHVGFANSGNNGILGSSGTTIASFWFRFPSALPTSDFRILIGIGTAGGQDMIFQYLTSTTGLQMALGASTQLGPLVVADTWYHAEVRTVLNANPHTVTWTIDGTAQTSLSLAVASENVLYLGWGSDNSTQQGTMDFTDAVVSLTSADYPLGKHKVVQLIPDTAGTATEIGTANSMSRFTANLTADATFNSANILTAISEVPPVSGATATGITQRAGTTTDAAEIPMTTYTLQPGETITGSRICVQAWGNGNPSGNTLGVRGYNGSAETTVFAAGAYQGNNVANYASICKMYTGLTDQTTLDAHTVRIGYSSDIAPIPGAHAIYTEVAIKESTTLTVSPTAISSAEAHGTAAASLSGAAAPTAIASAEAFGTAAQTNTLLTAPTAVASQEAFGTSAQTNVLTTSPTAISSAQAFGTTAASLTLTVSPAGVSSQEAFGTTATSSTLIASPSSVFTAESFGAPSTTQTTPLSPTAIPSAEAHGTHAASMGALTTSPTGVPSAEAVGTPVGSLGALTLQPAGTASLEAFGTPQALTAGQSSPAGIPSAEAFGSPTAQAGVVSVSPTNITSAEAFGTTAQTSSLTAQPTGIASQESHGAPSLLTIITTSPQGIVTAEQFGFGTSQATLTAQPAPVSPQESFGTPQASSALATSPLAIPSQESVPSPEALSTLLLLPEWIPSAQAFGSPTATGGVPAVHRDLDITVSLMGNRYSLQVDSNHLNTDLEPNDLMVTVAPN